MEPRTLGVKQTNQQTNDEGGGSPECWFCGRTQDELCSSEGSVLQRGGFLRAFPPCREQPAGDVCAETDITGRNRLENYMFNGKEEAERRKIAGRKCVDSGYQHR